MRVKFSKPKRIKIDDIDAFSEELGYLLSARFRSFLLKYNGAKPEVNIFKVTDSIDSGINEIISLEAIIEERKYLQLEDDFMLPICIAEGGNYVVYDVLKDDVFFWDHEEPDELYKLASDINEFLSDLEPFSVDNVELDEGQVESAWIDPDFLKGLK